MKILAISDTHGELPDTSAWPEADVFVHAGDAGPNPTNSADDLVVQRAWLPGFRAWASGVRAGVRVFVPGNHDLFAEQRDDGLAGCGVEVLRCDASSLAGVFGVSWTVHDRAVFDFPWAFGGSEAEIAEHFALIPGETEILISHGGIRGYLDERPGREVGSTALGSRAGALGSLRLVIHGHAHEAGGTWASRGGALWVNVARRVVLIDTERLGDGDGDGVRVVGSLD